MTHQTQQILVRVETKDRLPKEKGSYIIGSGTKIKTDYFNGKKFSYDFHNETTYWYEPATAIVLSEEDYLVMQEKLRIADEMVLEINKLKSLTTNP